jgi:hypothetical protein
MTKGKQAGGVICACGGGYDPFEAEKSGGLQGRVFNVPLHFGEAISGSQWSMLHLHNPLRPLCLLCTDAVSDRLEEM